MRYSAPAAAQLTFGSQSESSRPLQQPTQCAEIEQHRGRVEQRRGLPRYPAADCLNRLPRPVYDFAALNQLPVLLALQHVACLAESPQLVVGEHTAAVGIERANNCPDRIGQPGTDWFCVHWPSSLYWRLDGQNPLRVPGWLFCCQKAVCVFGCWGDDQPRLVIH